MTGARFPSCQAWHGLVSSGRRTGQTSGARRCKHLKARLAGTGLSKFLCTTNLKALILMPYCTKQSRFRGTPLQINSYQHGFKNTWQHPHRGSSILLQNSVQVHSGQVPAAVWRIVILPQWLRKPQEKGWRGRWVPRGRSRGCYQAGGSVDQHGELWRGRAAEHTPQHLGVTQQDRLCTANRFLRAQFMLCNTNPGSLGNEPGELLSRSLMIKGAELALITNCCSVS